MLCLLNPIKKGNCNEKKYTYVQLWLFFYCLAIAHLAQKNTVSALYIRISGTINPAQVDLLENGYRKAISDNFDLIIIGLDTPGGLAKSMREMVKIILNSHIPVVVWVGPKGARAASAGVFLVAASDIASMAPNTSIGSASPVSMGGKDVPKTLEKKNKKTTL